MKKVAMMAAGLLSLGYLGAEAEEKSTFSLDNLGLDTSVGFSTERVHRGRKQGRKVFTPSVELNMPFFEKGKVYAGCDAFLGAEEKKVHEVIPATRNEVNPYIGVSYDMTDMFTADAGYIRHFYTNDPKEITTYVPVVPAPAGGPQYTKTVEPFILKGESSEIYMGVMADVMLSPSVYFFYDFDCKETAIEGRVAYTYDLGQFGIGNVAVELGAQLGYDNAKKPFGVKKLELVGEDIIKKNYFYYGAKADLVYSFNEHAKARAGLELAGNSAKKKDAVNVYSGNKHNSFVWFNASVDCSF